MVRRLFLVAIPLLPLVACGDPATAPSIDGDDLQLAATRVEQVPICHLDEETGTFGLKLLPVRGKSLAAHMEHGDALPGDEVPGLPDAVFDEQCDVLEEAAPPPLPEPAAVLAIAYTDMDPNDGPGFKDGTDVLIAKLIDSSNDGMPSAGDEVVTGRYPKTLAPSGDADFGSFGVTSHAVQSVLTDSPTELVVASDVSTFRWERTSTSEQYREFPTAAEATATFVLDYLELVVGEEGVRTDIGSPSHPSEALSAMQMFSPSDDPFVDVEIVIPS